jgi:EAL and modified HD-GYP domain-containing signal transduction protein
VANPPDIETPANGTGPAGTGDSVFLARQPILDRSERQVGYELLFRNGNYEEANVVDGRAATAHVISNAFTHLSISSILGPYRAFINVDRDFLHDEAIRLMPTEKVVIEVLEGSLVTPQVVARCGELKSFGYTLALDDFARITEDYQPLLPLISIIKVDITLVPEEELPGLVAQLRPLADTLLAEKVETREEYERCRNMGFDLFQGYYFCRPIIVSGRKLQPGQLATLKLVSMLAHDAETHELERVLKEDAALSMSMLRLVNSVGMRTRTTISSLRQAIVILGRQQFGRWLQLLLFADPTNADANPLLTLAATRGRLAELIAERARPGDHRMRDSAYMAGVLSLTPTLLGRPLEEILPLLRLAPPLQEALLTGKGVLGAILAMCGALESGIPEELLAAHERLGPVSAEVLNACHGEAIAWANQIGQTAAEE